VGLVLRDEKDKDRATLTVLKDEPGLVLLDASGKVIRSQP